MSRKKVGIKDRGMKQIKLRVSPLCFSQNGYRQQTVYFVHVERSTAGVKPSAVKISLIYSICPSNLFVVVLTKEIVFDIRKILSVFFSEERNIHQVL